MYFNIDYITSGYLPKFRTESMADTIGEGVVTVTSNFDVILIPLGIVVGLYLFYTMVIKREGASFNFINHGIPLIFIFLGIVWYFDLTFISNPFFHALQALLDTLPF